MPFGLKNGGATYQHTMQRCLRPQLGQNIHVYVDDLVVKSMQGSTLLADLEEKFANLRTYQIKLNPEKCVFGVPADKLLGFLVSERGIEPRDDRSNRSDEQAKKPERCAEVHWLPGVAQPIPQSARREGDSFIPVDEEDGQVLMDRSSR